MSIDRLPRTMFVLLLVVAAVDWARVLVGFHYRNSDLQGTSLGRKVGRYVGESYFQPIR